MNSLKMMLLVCAATAALPGARPLTTDRPDATESPFTVEPGLVQVEVSAAQWTRDRRNVARNGARVETWAVAPINVRFGLTTGTEIQIVHDGYLDVSTRDRIAGTTDRRRGAGDLTLRFKANLRGNDAGATAWGVMPYVKFPTAATGLGNDAVEGGIIVPFATDLPGDWGFGAMTDLALVRNEADTGHRAAWLNTATISRALTARTGIFGELTLQVGEGRPAATFNFGMTCAAGENAQFDLGVNLGLTRAADDLAIFAGWAGRF